MKLVMLLYLEEDEGCVDRFLRETGVAVFSRTSIEGIGGALPGGKGGQGWYGETAPYASRLAFAIVPPGQAEEILAAVDEGRGGLDNRNHPVRAFQLPIEAAAACGHQESSS
jgi:hypothetical protein